MEIGDEGAWDRVRAERQKELANADALGLGGRVALEALFPNLERSPLSEDLDGLTAVRGAACAPSWLPSDGDELLAAGQKQMTPNKLKIGETSKIALNANGGSKLASALKGD